jgi:hypothetical protein
VRLLAGFATGLGLAWAALAIWSPHARGASPRPANTWAVTLTDVSRTSRTPLKTWTVIVQAENAQAAYNAAMAGQPDHVLMSAHPQHL